MPESAMVRAHAATARRDDDGILHGEGDATLIVGVDGEDVLDGIRICGETEPLVLSVICL